MISVSAAGESNLFTPEFGRREEKYKKCKFLLGRNPKRDEKSDVYWCPCPLDRFLLRGKWKIPSFFRFITRNAEPADLVLLIYIIILSKRICVRFWESAFGMLHGYKIYDYFSLVRFGLFFFHGRCVIKRNFAALFLTLGFPKFNMIRKKVAPS